MSDKDLNKPISKQLHLKNRILSAEKRFFNSIEVCRAQFSVINRPMNINPKYWSDLYFMPDFLKHGLASIVHTINVLQGAFNLTLTLFTEPTATPALALALLEDVTSVGFTALATVISLISLVSRPLVSLLNWELYDTELYIDYAHHEAIKDEFLFGAVKEKVESSSQKP